MQLLFLCSHYNCHKGFTLTTTRCSLRLTQCILTFRARSLMSRTNFVASLRLTPEKQNKNSIKKKMPTGCFSSYVYIFTLMFGFNRLSSLTKWVKSPSVKTLSLHSVAIHNRESKVIWFSWLWSLVFTSFICENKHSTQAMLIGKIKSKWSR